MRERINTLRSLEPQNSGQASYAAILESAAGLFRQFPADAITLRDILTISGVSNQTLYNYFPAGRDDIVIVLQDRFQRSITADFKKYNLTIALDPPKEGIEVVGAMSATLARAAFGHLAEHFHLQATVLDYLKIHALDASTAQSQDLEEALEQELRQRYGRHFAPRELPRVVRLCVQLVRTLAEEAMTHPDHPIDGAESNARKLLRVLLQTALNDDDPTSGKYKLPPYTPAPTAIAGASLSAAKKETILNRLLKKKRGQ